MNKSFDSLFQFHKSTVRNKIDHLTTHFGIDGELAFDFIPWVGGKLLKTQRYTLTVFIDLNNVNGDFLTSFDHFTRMRNSTPAHISDMKQAVQTIEID